MALAGKDNTKHLSVLLSKPGGQQTFFFMVELFKYAQEPYFFWIFKESALWVDSFYKSYCPYVCLSVCLFVRHTFSLRLTFFLPPLPEFQCPNF